MAKYGGNLELNWVQVLASGLAALSSAVLLSTTGVAGTVIGAALGSIVLTVGSAVYGHYLAVSKERVAAARSLALQRASQALVRARAGAPMDFDSAVRQPVPKDDPATGSGGRVRWREAVRTLRWRPVLATAVGAFVLVMGVIVSLELMTGRALSSYTGGTSSEGPQTSIPMPAGLGRQSDTAPRLADQPGRSEDGGAPRDGVRRLAQDSAERASDTGATPVRTGPEVGPQLPTVPTPVPTAEVTPEPVPASQPAPPTPTAAPTTEPVETTAPTTAPTPAPTAAEPAP